MLIKLPEHITQNCKSGRLDAGSPRLTQRLQEKTLQLQRLSALEIDQGGRPVCAHRARSGDLGFFQAVLQFEPESPGSSDHFENELSNQPFPVGIGEQFVRREARTERTGDEHSALQNRFFARSAGYPQSVEWNVPGQLLPMRLCEIARDLARHTSISEHQCDVMSARFRPASKFSQDHCPMINVMNDSWLDTIQTDKTETSEDLLRPDDFSQLLFVAEAVLQSQDRCPWTN